MAPSGEDHETGSPGGSSARSGRRTPMEAGASVRAPSTRRYRREGWPRSRPSVVRVVGLAAAILQAGARRGFVGGGHRHVLTRLGGMRPDDVARGIVDGGPRRPAGVALAGMELDRDASRQLRSHALTSWFGHHALTLVASRPIELMDRRHQLRLWTNVAPAFGDAPARRRLRRRDAAGTGRRLPG